MITKQGTIIYMEGTKFKIIPIDFIKNPNGKWTDDISIFVCDDNQFNKFDPMVFRNRDKIYYADCPEGVKRIKKALKKEVIKETKLKIEGLYKELEALKKLEV